MDLAGTKPSHMFRSATPQRGSMGGGANSPSFERSGAVILGPGSYDFAMPEWIRTPTKQSLCFASTRKQREDAPSAVLSKDIDLMHTANLARSAQLSRSVFCHAPGTNGLRWTTSARGAPYFHPPSRPYSFGVDSPAYDRGPDTDYNVDNGTIEDRLKRGNRNYNTCFTSKLPLRAPVGGSDNQLGPGAYNQTEECFCGGIRVEARRGPSPCFAPAVGGRWK